LVYSQVNIFADVKERGEKREENFGSHASNELDTEPYAYMGLNKSVREEE
jgi:hypothetical protein